MSYIIVKSMLVTHLHVCKWSTHILCNHLHDNYMLTDQSKCSYAELKLMNHTEGEAAAL